jgi:hypothetical protein
MEQEKLNEEHSQEIIPLTEVELKNILSTIEHILLLQEKESPPKDP